MTNLFLIRGLPGTGKSTAARKIAEQQDGVVVEADDFFTDAVGTYRFDRRFLGAAHDLAYGSTIQHLRNGVDVAVANTFSTVRELKRYIDGVARCGLDVGIVVVKCDGDFESPHGVPQRAIEKMAGRWEDFAGEMTYQPEPEQHEVRMAA